MSEDPSPHLPPSDPLEPLRLPDRSNPAADHRRDSGNGAGSGGVGVPAWWTFSAAEDMRRELQRDDATVLGRRQELLTRVAARRPTPPSPLDGRRLVAEAVRQATCGNLPADDLPIVELALALADLDVRDYALGFSAGPDAAAAEELWTVLLRRAPGSYCAAPAVLTAVSAYLRGDDLRARVALDLARTASPTYRIAALLDRNLDLGVPRAEFAAMVHRLARLSADPGTDPGTGAGDLD